MASGDFGAAADAFEQALGYWTGPALADVGDYPFAAASARRLQDLRIALVEARNDAYLGVGRHLEVLADADSWIAMEPLREHLQRAARRRALPRGTASRQRCARVRTCASSFAMSSGWNRHRKCRRWSGVCSTRTKVSLRTRVAC